MESALKGKLTVRKKQTGDLPTETIPSQWRLLNQLTL